MASEGSGMNILLVEDEPHVRRALARSLEAWGHELTEAGSAELALAAIAAIDFDLIVLDVNLPDATGWDVLRRRQSDKAVDAPTIVISAIPPSVVRLHEFQPFGVLHKPFPIESLHQLVNKAEAHLGLAVHPQGEPQ